MTFSSVYDDFRSFTPSNIRNNKSLAREWFAMLQDKYLGRNCRKFIAYYKAHSLLNARDFRPRIESAGWRSLVSATGSYSVGHQFKSDSRYILN